MKNSLAGSFALVAALAASPGLLAATHALDGGERGALISAQDAGLESLRAGASDDRAGLGVDERAALRQASVQSHELGQLRGGALVMSDHDLKVIGVILLAVLVVAVIV